MKYRAWGPLAIVAAAILWSLDGLLRRELYSLPPMIVVFWEHLLGIIILLPFVAPRLRNFRVLNRSQWTAITLVSLLSGALGTYFYTAGLLKIGFIPFSVVVLLQQLQPLFAILTAAILLKEPLGKKFLGLAIVALVAAYFVSFPTLRVTLGEGNGTVIAAGFALLAAIAWGSSTAFSKLSLQGTSFLSITAIRFALTPIFALVLISFFGQTESLMALTSTQWWNILAITFSTGLLALAIYYFGLQRVPASRATILELTWPVSALLTGYLFLGERLTLTQWIGTVVLVITMYVVARDARKVEALKSQS